MSSRRNGSVSRAAETASKNRLHMDRNPQHSRINDPSNPAGRRKEIDNVMKRARQASPGSWDRKLLEVEERDPNRWRHTGYKQLYLEGGGSPKRSPVAGRRSRTRSPPPRRSRTPVARRSRTPLARRSPRKSRSPRRSPRRSPIRRSPPPRRRPARPSPRRARPPSPPPRQSSGSGSSVSSCSDESCSVCSAKNKKPGAPPVPPKGAKPPPPRPKSKSPNRKRPAPARAVQPTRELLKAREASKRSREEKVLEWQRSQLSAHPPRAPLPAAHIKREGERRPAAAAPSPSPAPAPAPAQRAPRSPPARGVSPAAIAAALADSDDSETTASDEPPQRLTLSERFGKMAQWSADRSARLENMRITRREATLHVRIERDEEAHAAEMAAAEPYVGADPEPLGSYPEELLAVAPSGLPSWDDVRVRYDYYKKRGYLRGLTLGDYVKWEEWWYKYQEWLKRERAYERWADADMGGSTRRERRRRGGRHRRS
ncbi:serine/arginine repetitive matrix protein 1 isoform X2 [Plodia interpunctella]|uniref:serine/arginine repetitive matrix protein 1 isoform X2 n=1 Tax=Plodia interpunctella TaxID=58824 RepID=UPI002368C6B8|nr:serine/arginine repetitive matrix protein 1 isoform X2 [Plodia interpunctella]XP_053623172.1 serine/arginine repetitive matrix protein 1 isoform X2 [Plodia interpunctella]